MGYVRQFFFLFFVCFLLPLQLFFTGLHSAVLACFCFIYLVFPSYFLSTFSSHQNVSSCFFKRWVFFYHVCWTIFFFLQFCSTRFCNKRISFYCTSCKYDLSPPSFFFFACFLVALWFQTLSTFCPRKTLFAVFKLLFLLFEVDFYDASESDCRMAFSWRLSFYWSPGSWLSVWTYSCWPFFYLFFVPLWVLLSFFVVCLMHFAIIVNDHIRLDRLWGLFFVSRGHVCARGELCFPKGRKSDPDENQHRWSVQWKWKAIPDVTFFFLLWCFDLYITKEAIQAKQKGKWGVAQVQSVN